MRADRSAVIGNGLRPFSGHRHRFGHVADCEFRIDGCVLRVLQCERSLIFLHARRSKG